jgi:hypothetical protein
MRTWNWINALNRDWWDEATKWAWAIIPSIVVGVVMFLWGAMWHDNYDGSYQHAPWWWWVGVLPAALVVSSTLQWTLALPIAKMSICYGIPETRFGGNYSSSYSLHNEVQRYWEMRSDDKQEYPDNILWILRDERLTHEQRRRIGESMRDTRLEINRRANARAALISQGVDIESVLSTLEHNRAGLKSDTETYKEA